MCRCLGHSLRCVAPDPLLHCDEMYGHQLTDLCGAAERCSRASMDLMDLRLQSEDEDAESMAEKLDIFPPSRSGYTQKVWITGQLCMQVRCHAIVEDAGTLDQQEIDLLYVKEYLHM